MAAGAEPPAQRNMKIPGGIDIVDDGEDVRC